jgi:hypothetical protein
LEGDLLVGLEIDDVVFGREAVTEDLGEEEKIKV